MANNRYQGVALFCVVGLLIGAIAGATGRADAAKPKPNGTPPVQLRRVVLLNAGVGYFEYTGQVEGSTTIDLKFRRNDVNDLLKSLVLQDLGGGQISTVTYNARQPIAQTLKSRTIDLATNPTLSQLLAQVRGARVEIDGPIRVSGTIVGVERRRGQTESKATVVAEFLNLLTDQGLRSLPLDSVGAIRLLDKKLDAELRAALAILARGHAEGRKTVSIHFDGKGTREVRIGYVQETPVWKMSYRLVLGKTGPPLLQGWAIVENTTESDWDGIDLKLISGRPLSFVMDLYRPVYIERPVVQPELYSSLGPRVYDQDLSGRSFRQRSASGAMGEGGHFGGMGGGIGGGMGGMGGSMGGEGGYGGVPVERPNDKPRKAAQEEDEFAFGRSVRALAQAEKVGELFEYHIRVPVTIAQDQGAMLSVVNGPVQAEKLSIYNERVQAKHPLNGLRLTNTTKVHLMTGPMTVFDGGEYAGDAEISDVAPGASRLLSYGLDLNVEVACENPTQSEQLVSVRLLHGTLLATRRLVRKRGYVVKNSATEAKHVLVEYPIDTDWKLVAPAKPAETTRKEYRFQVDVAPGQSADLLVKEQRDQQTKLELIELDGDATRFYLQAKSVSPSIKESLRAVVTRQRAIQLLAEKRRTVAGQIAAIDQDQTRIRKNLGPISANSDLHSRYIQKLSAQEDQLEVLRKTIKLLVTEESEKRKSLSEYLTALDVE